MLIFHIVFELTPKSDEKEVDKFNKFDICHHQLKVNNYFRHRDGVLKSRPQSRVNQRLSDFFHIKIIKLPFKLTVRDNIFSFCAIKLFGIPSSFLFLRFSHLHIANFATPTPNQRLADKISSDENEN